jgi:hypothetical protein
MSECSKVTADYSEINPEIKAWPDQNNNKIEFYYMGDLLLFNPNTAVKMFLCMAQNGMKESVLDADSIKTLIKILMGLLEGK